MYRCCARRIRTRAMIGEAVAAVAAEDLLTAKRAVAAIKVVYEPLTPVFDPDEAMRPGAPLVHDYAPDNITKHIPIRVGDVEQGFARSDLVVEENYSTQAIEHAYLEPEAGLSYVVFDPDEAMRPGAPVVHDYAPDNITKHIPIRVGDVEQGFARSDLVVEENYSTQAIEHAYLEPEAGLSYV